MPRKGKILRRTAGLYIYCTPAEKKRIKIAAMEADKSVTTFVLEIVLREIEKLTRS